MFYIDVDLHFSSFILDMPEIFASSPLSSSVSNNYKSEPPLSIKPNKYSSKRNDNANTIDTTSEDERKQQLVTKLHKEKLSSVMSQNTLPSLVNYEGMIPMTINESTNEINGDAILDTPVNTNTNVPTKSISIADFVKTKIPSILNQTKGMVGEETLAKVDYKSVITPLKATRLNRTTVQKLINETPTTTKMSKTEMQIKTSKKV